MPIARPAAKVLVLALSALALLAPTAPAAVGISSAHALGGGKALTTSSRLKEQLAATTVSPADGQTVSGSVVWQVSVSGGTASKVEFAIDGSAKWTQTTSPYVYGGAEGVLDTTKLSNGSHTLSATAYGARGAKATTKVTVTVSNSAPAAEPAPEPAPEPAAGTEAPLYWGATIGPQLTGTQAPWDMNAVTKFEEETRKKVSLVQFFMPFAQCNPTCSYYSFPKTPLENIRLHGSIPVLSWSSASIPSSKEEPNFQLSDVIAGTYDGYIRQFAEAAKAWGHPFFLRYDWEMNGKWFSWSEGVNGNRAGEYVAAWRHVHDIFTAVGATNATWVWCPNVDPTNALQSLSSLYPGNEYVDWTGLDGYNWGTNPAKPNGWKTFGETFRSTYENVVKNVAPAKPLLISEVASSEDGGSKPAWIKDMLTRVPREYPSVRGLLWFDTYDGSLDWPIETSETSTAAFAEGIQNPAYVGNSLSSLAATAIQPPA